MAQLTIYLPDDLEEKARRAAKAEGKPVSRWIADRLVADLDDAWPEAVIKAAGAFPDFPALEDIRKRQGRDTRREPIE